ncbi:putative kinesin [Leptomonas seymouri]|uniref:Putative kinesin n=1 Tax=Leptomonas seymouri TaxID=5684 RepID=A0A0N1PB89_LEPSE|nr:putative kinesin [Leptomonas seymouri]|eukprot:KPI83175.1 putative kinesin [Leptomonas seymouri]
MIATISPHMINYDEMRQTIRYASRAKNIINWVKKNEDPQVVMIRELREKVANLELRLKEAGGSNYTNEYVRGLEKKVKELEKKCAEQERVIVALRAQLEFCGIADPTAQEGFLDSENKAKMDLQKAKAEEAMKRQLDKAQMTIAELRLELERRAKMIEPERLKVIKEKLEMQDLRLETVSAELVLYKRLWQHFGNIEAVMALVEDKEQLLLRACGNALSSTSTESSAIIDRMNKEREEDLAELKRRHEEELVAQAECFGVRMKDTLDDCAVQQQQLLDRHKDAVAQLEDRLQRTRELNDLERKRSEEENERFRQRLLDAQERMRLEYQQEVGRLRARVDGESSDRQRSGDLVRQQQVVHEREVARLTEDLERLKRSKATEVSRLQNQLENERLRRESDLMEKDRQLRLARNEVEDVKNAMEKLKDERNKMEKEYQDQIRCLMLQQEQLITVSNAVLADWEMKSSSLESDLHKLRGLLYDKDYMNFRQKIREMAFMERDDYDQKFLELDEKEKLQAARISQIISMARRAFDEQHRSLKRFEKDVKERIGGRTKGLDGSEAGSTQASPPPEVLSNSDKEVVQRQ